MAHLGNAGLFESKERFICGNAHLCEGVQGVFFCIYFFLDIIQVHQWQLPKATDIELFLVSKWAQRNHAYSVIFGSTTSSR